MRSSLVGLKGRALRRSSKRRTPMFQALTWSTSDRRRRGLRKRSGQLLRLRHSFRKGRARRTGFCCASFRKSPKQMVSFMLSLRKRSCSSTFSSRQSLLRRQPISSIRSTRKQATSNSLSPSRLRTSASTVHSYPLDTTKIDSPSEMTSRMGVTILELRERQSWRMRERCWTSVLTCRTGREKQQTWQRLPFSSPRKVAWQPNLLQLRTATKCRYVPSWLSFSTVLRSRPSMIISLPHPYPHPHTRLAIKLRITQQQRKKAAFFARVPSRSSCSTLELVSSPITGCRTPLAASRILSSIFPLLSALSALSPAPSSLCLRLERLLLILFEATVNLASWQTSSGGGVGESEGPSAGRQGSVRSLESISILIILLMTACYHRALNLFRTGFTKPNGTKTIPLTRTRSMAPGMMPGELQVAAARAFSAQSQISKSFRHQFGEVLHVLRPQGFVYLLHRDVSLQLELHLPVARLLDRGVHDGEQFWRAADVPVHLHHTSERGRRGVVVEASIRLGPDAVEPSGDAVPEGAEEQIHLVSGSAGVVDLEGCVEVRVRVVLGPSLSGVQSGRSRCLAMSMCPSGRVGCCVCWQLLNCRSWEQAQSSVSKPLELLFGRRGRRCANSTQPLVSGWLRRWQLASSMLDSTRCRSSRERQRGSLILEALKKWTAEVSRGSTIEQLRVAFVSRSSRSLRCVKKAVVRTDLSLSARAALEEEALARMCSSSWSCSSGLRSQTSYSTTSSFPQRSRFENDQLGLRPRPKWWFGWCENSPRGSRTAKRKLPRFSRGTEVKPQVDWAERSGFSGAESGSAAGGGVQVGVLSWQKVWSHSLAQREQLGRLGVFSFIRQIYYLAIYCSYWQHLRMQQCKPYRRLWAIIITALAVD